MFESSISIICGLILFGSKTLSMSSLKSEDKSLKKLCCRTCLHEGRFLGQIYSINCNISMVSSSANIDCAVSGTHLKKLRRLPKDFCSGRLGMPVGNTLFRSELNSGQSYSEGKLSSSCSCLIIVGKCSMSLRLGNNGYLAIISAKVHAIDQTSIFSVYFDEFNAISGGLNHRVTTF